MVTAAESTVTPNAIPLPSDVTYQTETTGSVTIISTLGR